MSRDASGTYTLPNAVVVSGNAITSTWANTSFADFVTEFSDSLSRSGKGGMSAGLKLADGTVTLPGLSFTTETNTGLYVESAGVVGMSIGGVKVLDVQSSGVDFVGEVTATGFTGTLDGILGGGTPAAATVTEVTSTGIAILPAATTGLSPLRIPHGTAHSTPTDGDIWTTSSGVFARVNGGTTTLGAAAGTDVTRVGTPVNNQLGVWTGDGTLEGDANLTFDGATLTTTGFTSTSSVTVNAATPSISLLSTEAEDNKNIYFRSSSGFEGVIYHQAGVGMHLFTYTANHLHVATDIIAKEDGVVVIQTGGVDGNSADTHLQLAGATGSQAATFGGTITSGAVNSNVKLNTEVLEIGAWNMYNAGGGSGSLTKSVFTTITGSKIRTVQAFVYDDDGFAGAYPINYQGDGWHSWATGASATIFLTTVTSGFFDSTNFNSTTAPANRGYVVIEYTD